MNIINLKYLNIFGYNVLLWWNKHYEFKLIKIDNRMYKKHSLYLGKLIFEMGKSKYGTNNKSVRTVKK
jgi:hypothetical protein